MTLSISTFSITTLNIKRLCVTLSISATQHNNALPPYWVSHIGPLYWVSLCWMSIWWMALCWVSWCLQERMGTRTFISYEENGVLWLQLLQTIYLPTFLNCFAFYSFVLRRLYSVTPACAVVTMLGIFLRLNRLRLQFKHWFPCLTNTAPRHLS